VLQVDELAKDLVARLTAAGTTLATAESLTGGLLGGVITEVPGASAVYRGGVVAYATELKVTLLGVAEDLVDEFGVVSAECAEAMATGARSAAGSTYALSTTGVAGPDRQDGLPPGSVYVGWCGPTGSGTRALTLSGDRGTIRWETCRQAITMLLDILAEEETTLR
jgi:nicotinamide-nucleotide amidase